MRYGHFPMLHLKASFIVVIILSAAVEYSIGRRIKMKVDRSDGDGGAGIVLTPSKGEYSNVVFWFHGLGDTADGWASAMPQLGIPDTKFVLPTASSRPISLNMGMPMPGWSDIYGLDHLSAEDAKGFAESAERVNRLIQHEIEKGIDPSKIILAGFSQGGALALHVALRHQTASFGACVALSTWLPLRADYPAALSSKASNLPILQVHGSADNVVNHQWGEGSHHALKSMISSPTPEFMTIQGMGHSSHPQEMEAVKSFISRILGV